MSWGLGFDDVIDLSAVKAQGTGPLFDVDNMLRVFD